MTLFEGRLVTICGCVCSGLGNSDCRCSDCTLRWCSCDGSGCFSVALMIVVSSALVVWHWQFGATGLGAMEIGRTWVLSADLSINLNKCASWMDELPWTRLSSGTTPARRESCIMCHFLSS